ncbi:unnamed protein product, partial [Schistosoma margrebowiei]
MGRLSKKRARKSPNTSDNNNSVITYPPCSATPFEADNVGIDLTPHLMLNDSVSNLIMSSTSRSKSIDNIKSELNTAFKQLTDMRSKVESLASFLSKHDDLKQEIKTSSPLKLLLFDSHILAERLKESKRLICALTKFRDARIVSDRTTNQRLTQKRTLTENKGVEITRNHDASAAGFTDAATLSHVLQYSDIPTKNANLPVMSVVTSDNGLQGYSTSNALNNKPVRHNYSQHFPIGQDGLQGYSTPNVSNNKPVRRNFPQHLPIGQDGLLGYAPSTQPQLADSSVTLKRYRFSKPYELYIPVKYRIKLKRLQNRYFKSNDLTAVAQITIIFNQIKGKHRLKAIIEELLALNTNSKVQNLTLLFNKHTKATRVDGISSFLYKYVVDNYHYFDLAHELNLITTFINQQAVHLRNIKNSWLMLWIAIIGIQHNTIFEMQLNHLVIQPSCPKIIVSISDKIENSDPNGVEKIDHSYVHFNSPELIACFKESDKHYEKMNEFLSRIDCWTVGNGFILNPSKCQAGNLSMRRECHLYTVLRSHNACAIGDSLKNTMSKVILFGFTFSYDLSLSAHFLLLSKSTEAAFLKPRAPFKLAAFNVCTLMQVGQQLGLAMSLESLRIDVCCLSETPIQDSGEVLQIRSTSVTSKSFFYVRLSVDPVASSSGLAGVGVALSARAEAALIDWIPINSRL